jgi:hypothetical protein
MRKEKNNSRLEKQMYMKYISVCNSHLIVRDTVKTSKMVMNLPIFIPQTFKFKDGGKGCCDQSKEYSNSWVLVAHACNPSYSGSRHQDWGLKPAQANCLRDPILKILKTRKG